ncbi:MAG: hypothetical protein V1748_02860 [Actinomycetota bacterium]
MEETREPKAVPRAGSGARVLREVIRTPAFLEIIKTNTTGLDPEAARELVRTALLEDVNLSLSLSGTLPEVINYLLEAALEAGRVFDGLPPHLIAAFGGQVAERIDMEKVAELPRVYGPLLEKVGARDSAAGALARLINTGARWVNRAATSDPYFLRDVAEQVDGLELLRAGTAVARSLALTVFSLTGRLVRRLSEMINKG